MFSVCACDESSSFASPLCILDTFWFPLSVDVVPPDVNLDGLYLEHQGVGIAQYMFATFLPSQSCRKYLKLRKQQSVDFRAACFCHKRVVDIAYV